MLCNVYLKTEKCDIIFFSYCAYYLSKISVSANIIASHRSIAARTRLSRKHRQGILTVASSTHTHTHIHTHDARRSANTLVIYSNFPRNGRNKSYVGMSGRDAILIAMLRVIVVHTLMTDTYTMCLDLRKQ